jgi:glutamine amidotransferase
VIAIIDYGVGNLRSVQKAVEKIGLEAIITKDNNEINNSKGIILPGVGAFRDAIDSLKKSGLIPVIKENIAKRKPLLGICLGMQLLYEKSYEDGIYDGLGLIEGEIIKFDKGLKIPHMGWNSLNIKRQDEILKYVNENDYVYFVHSYYIKSSNEELLSWADYGVKVPAIVKKDNIYGMQFHPEKSGDVGLRLLKAYGELIK